MLNQVISREQLEQASHEFAMWNTHREYTPGDGYQKFAAGYIESYLGMMCAFETHMAKINDPDMDNGKE